MAKRETKAKREARQRAELLQRIEDIYAGATGAASVDFHPEDFWLTLEDAPRVIAAIRATFGESTDDGGKPTNDHLFAAHNINQYEQPQRLADFLFDNGVRT